ncbi:microneme associated antigen [Plasmodium gonderi]|uniref:Microneme associated antigen n=1 Tax=Plasmodium gonderi TaxID=77519 RepID=A0A1Y1JJM4_PLAGO|nr:microneme associated antigen [Plasmodium gonderi]GAW80663.1 microneme associated antigen [Plasmodium gonderi]
MHDYFIRTKFNLLNNGIFNSIYRNCSNYKKDERRNGMDLGTSPNSFSNSTHTTSHGKRELNEQLIYSYYNNFANEKSASIKSENSDLNAIYDREGSRNQSNNHSCNYNSSNYNHSNYSNHNSRDIHNNLEIHNNRDIPNNHDSHTKQEHKMHDLHRNGCLKHFFPKYEKYGHKGEEILCVKNTNEVIKEEGFLYEEFKKLKNDVLALQIMNVNLQKQVLANHSIMGPSKVVPQHIIINNKTEVASNAISQIQDNKKKNNGFFYLLLKKLLSSRFAQMFFVSSFFISIYLFNKHWQRALKVSQLEKRINSNIILKSVRMLEETFGIRKFSYM